MVSEESRPFRVEHGWRVPAGNGKVTQIRVDYALTLLISVNQTEGLELLIEGRFHFTDGAVSALIEWDEPAELSRFASLHGKTVSAIELDDSGELVVAFGSSAELRVSPDPHFESFNLVSSASVADGGFLFVGMPAGELAVWVADEADET